MKVFDVYYTNEAFDDLLSIHHYIADDLKEEINAKKQIEKIRDSINGFLFSEFEDDYWAEVNYSMHMDLAFEHDSFMDESDYLKGYAFLYDESDVYSTIYYACYITDCCFIKYCYWFNSPDVENYQVYLEVCEELGVPTCSEMTEAITT